MLMIKPPNFSMKTSFEEHLQNIKNLNQKDGFLKTVAYLPAYIGMHSLIGLNNYINRDKTNYRTE